MLMRHNYPALPAPLAARPRRALELRERAGTTVGAEQRAERRRRRIPVRGERRVAAGGAVGERVAQLGGREVLVGADQRRQQEERRVAAGAAVGKVAELGAKERRRVVVAALGREDGDGGENGEVPNRAEEVGRVGAEGDARGGARDEHDVGLREHLGPPRRHAAEVVDAEDDAEPLPAAAARRRRRELRRGPQSGG